MNKEHASGYCNYCAKNRNISRKLPNDLLHLAVSLLSGVAGFWYLGKVSGYIFMATWIIIWFLLHYNRGPYICTVCGKKTQKLEE